MPQILGVDERVEVKNVAQTKIMKDTVPLVLPRRPREPLIVPPTKTEGPSVHTKPIDAHRSNLGASIEFKIVYQRYSL